MSKHGQYSFAIGKEMDRKLAAIKSIALGMYGGKNCKKLQRVHVAVTDPYNVRRVRMGNARCQCGGHTFSDLMGGAKVVCRHCGKVYLKSEFDALPTRELTPVEREDRHIFSLLLAGGDLREDKERDLLILKDRSGIPEGDLPLAYGEHFAEPTGTPRWSAPLWPPSGRIGWRWSRPRHCRCRGGTTWTPSWNFCFNLPRA